MDLTQYKKAWENQPEEKNKVSALEIYKMTQAKSTSIVKWIFIIGLLEFVVLNSLVFFIDIDQAHEEYDKIGLKKFIIASEIVAYCVAIFFIVRFYINYRTINTADSTKILMSKILKTRKTVRQYVLFNLSYMFIIIVVVAISFVKVNMETIPDDRFALLIAFFILGGLAILTVIWLFYQLLYGFLLKKLKRNYKELSNLEIK
ncbi:hypothetical protein [Pseudotenacibaculum haliotis]|uniref:Beta-carotene 15,15'-monooxygenase n=1 Tax=Pseudotenacibaculum haliotis TaxID=1862138 RepID=A0ABW5LVM9_9FLAO